MGVIVETISASGNTEKPTSGMTCIMQYKGTLQSGQEFDSSYKRNRPFKFQIGVGQVIRGWDEGVIQMSKGDKAKLTISSDFAYGTEGVPDVIPPNATLIFEVILEDFF